MIFYWQEAVMWNLQENMMTFLNDTQSDTNIPKIVYVHVYFRVYRFLKSKSCMLHANKLPRKSRISTKIVILILIFRFLNCFFTQMFWKPCQFWADLHLNLLGFFGTARTFYCEKWKRIRFGQLNFFLILCSVLSRVKGKNGL